jgi:GNAT superfamily N-acetyltransferase
MAGPTATRTGDTRAAAHGGAPLFAAQGFQARELARADVPRLQALFDASPEYSLAVNGRLPRADEAQAEFDELPPAHLGFTRRWVAGVFDNGDRLIGVAVVVADLAARGVWHVALFFVASALHGQGIGSRIWAALEDWARGAGAQWLRLGVVEGNAPAERFWAKHGFAEVRVRHGVDTGGLINTVRVMVKPLGPAGLAAYLEHVPRDRPDSTLP